LKKSSKKQLEKRGVFVAGRAQNAPGTSIHQDVRHPERNVRKRELNKQIQLETARNCGPFSVSGPLLSNWAP